MDRRGFLGMIGIVAAGCWLGLRGVFGARVERPLREAMYYKKID